MPLNRMPADAAASLGSLRDLVRKKTIQFTFASEGIQRDGFLVWHEGRVAAYENVCRHLPLKLDSGDGQLFTGDGRYIACPRHGALYEPGTGLCIRGPCERASLKPLAIEVVDGIIWLTATH